MRDTPWEWLKIKDSEIIMVLDLRIIKASCMIQLQVQNNSRKMNFERKLKMTNNIINTMINMLADENDNMTVSNDGELTVKLTDDFIRMIDKIELFRMPADDIHTNWELTEFEFDTDNDNQVIYYYASGDYDEKDITPADALNNPPADMIKIVFNNDDMNRKYETLNMLINANHVVFID